MTEVDQQAESARIALVGEIDIINAAVITDEVAAALTHGHSLVALDMSAVQFIDSTGLGAMVAARNLCDAAGAGLTIANPSQPVVRLLALTGLDKVFRTVAID